MSTAQVALLASVQQFLDRQHGLYIDGTQQASQSEQRLTVWNPATGQAIASTADANAADVDRAVMSAWRAFVARSWAGRTPADRERILLRFCRSGRTARRRTGAAGDAGAGEIHPDFSRI
ncbi:Phenylacetaldehyde dehydrogenase [Raoultella ornithinolytica]|nr:Phenylacetaldehyde dehydrogenase [Raoultella ornithinolytica]